MSCYFCIVALLVISTISAFDHNQTNITNSTTDNTDGSIDVNNVCLEYKPQSCSGVCGQFFSLWCSCDEYCQIYGRCCFDYESVCKEESEKSKQDHKNLMNVTIECDSKISGYNVPQQIITSCPQTNVSLKTIELCEEEPRSSAVVSKVMSKRTELHYKNRHCMLCNGEDEDDIVYWSTMIGSLDRRQRHSSLNSILQLFHNSVRIMPPPNSREIICFPKMISTCLPNSTQEKQRLCQENSLSPIRYMKSIYKNTFCLQCNVKLDPTKNCHLAERKDIFYGTYEQSYAFSMVFSWKNERESTVFIDSQMSFIQTLSCSLDDNENLKECNVIKCIGTLPVVNNTCQVLANNFGCIQYIFKINFTVPSESLHQKELEVDRISSKVVQVAAGFERMYNVTKYYSKNVTLYNITLVDDQITGMIILNRMAYSLCNSKFGQVSSDEYFKYLDTNLAINLNGSIITKRYTTKCIYWCESIVSLIPKYLYQRSFTSNTKIDLDATSFVNIITPLPIYMYIVSLLGLLVI